MLELSRLRTGHQASLACPGYARVVGNRYTSDLVAGVNMICIGINIERSAGAGFGEVVGEDGNGGTESRRRRSARGWWTMRQPAGRCQAVRGSFLLLRRLSIDRYRPRIDCGWSLLNHGVAERRRCDLGNLNPD